MYSLEVLFEVIFTRNPEPAFKWKKSYKVRPRRYLTLYCPTFTKGICFNAKTLLFQTVYVSNLFYMYRYYLNIWSRSYYIKQNVRKRKTIFLNRLKLNSAYGYFGVG